MYILWINGAFSTYNPLIDNGERWARFDTLEECHLYSDSAREQNLSGFITKGDEDHCEVVEEW